MKITLIWICFSTMKFIRAYLMIIILIAEYMIMIILGSQLNILIIFNEILAIDLRE